MTKLDAVRQSPASVLRNAKVSRKQYDRVWSAAARAPLFCKITKKTLPDGKVRLSPCCRACHSRLSPLKFDRLRTRCPCAQTKKYYRTARLIGSHAYMIAASGAAANAAKIMEGDCGALREDSEQESLRAPWMPQVSKGAKMVLEQWLCALAQEATQNAHAVRESAGSTKRLNSKHMKVGWDMVYENVFATTAMMPRTMYIAQPSKKAKPSSKKRAANAVGADGDDEDYSPPEDGTIDAE